MDEREVAFDDLSITNCYHKVFVFESPDLPKEITIKVLTVVVK